jgi:hypothetical protein
VKHFERFLVLGKKLRVELTWLALVVLSIGIVGLRGLPTLLLFFAFCFLVVALGFIWSTLSSLGQTEPMTVEEALEYAALTHNEERKVAVLRGLKDLEYEHALGKISDEDYGTLTRRYRQQARHLLEQLDSDDATLRQRVLDAVEQRIGEGS